jgi:hypothetical protein
MTVKLVANMLELTLRQSVQWHVKHVPMPSPRIGYESDDGRIGDESAARLQVRTCCCSSQRHIAQHRRNT